MINCKCGSSVSLVLVVVCHTLVKDVVDIVTTASVGIGPRVSLIRRVYW